MERENAGEKVKIAGDTRIKSDMPNKMKLRTLLLDISGVIGDVRGTVSWKIKVAMEESDLDRNYGIGFTELMKAYSSGGWDLLWERYSVKRTDVKKYFRVWSAIQEYPPGSVRIYSEVPFVLKKLLKANLDVVFLTRSTNENVENVLSELKRRNLKEQIKVINPQTEDERKNDSKFVEKVLYRAYTDTSPPRAYVGDELDRGPQLRIFDEDIVVIGSGRGFFSVKNLQTMYYKWVGNVLDFQNFDDESDALKKEYRRVFNYVITNLEDLLETIEGQ